MARCPAHVRFRAKSGPSNDLRFLEPRATDLFSQQLRNWRIQGEGSSPRSAVVTRRRTLTLGKLKRSLDAARELGEEPKSEDLLLEFQHRLSLLLADCDDESDRARLTQELAVEPTLGEA